MKEIKGNSRKFKENQGNSRKFKEIQGKFKEIQGNSRKFKEIQGNSGPIRLTLIVPQQCDRLRKPIKVSEPIKD